MICVIRIAGQVKVKKDIVETLNRLRLRKKFACVLIDEKDVVKMGMVRKVENSVAYGKVSEGVVKKLKDKRGKKGKDWFALHPPVGGFKKSTKVAYPKGILGKHEDISKLLVRML